MKEPADRAVLLLQKVSELPLESRAIVQQLEMVPNRESSADAADRIEYGILVAGLEDPEELVSKAAYRTLPREFVRAVAAAQATLREAGREDEAARLDGVTWHALRHTFASRLVAAGVDLRTVQELGGWRTLSMVQRYAHLSPGHLAAAVEKIVAAPSVVVSETASVGELRQNFESVEAAIRDGGMRH